MSRSTRPKTREPRWFDGDAAARMRRRVRPGKPQLLQREAARVLGVSRTTVMAWEAESWLPTEEHLTAMAALYQCDEAAMCRFAPPWRAA